MRCPSCHRRLARGEACPRDGSRSGEASESTARAPHVDGFAIASKLGAGGAASVWRAKTSDGIDVALKVAHHGDAAMRARFDREAAALRRLDALCAPTFASAGVTGEGAPWIAMTVVDGETLAARLARQGGDGSLAIDEAIAIVARIAASLDVVRSRGLVHRDVKPENVVLAGAHATLLDFGLCVDADHDGAVRSNALTLDRSVLGTIAYTSPEQLADAGHVDARADVYSLGVIAFELLTGRPPFVGSASSIAIGQAAGRPPSLGSLRVEAAPFEDAIARALEKSPARRPSSAGAFATELSAACAKSPTRVATPAPKPATSNERAMVLLGSRSTMPLDDLATAVAPFGGVIARVHGDLRVVAFTATHAVAHGLRAAVLASHRLRAAWASTECTVHVSTVRVRDAARGTLAGADLERPARWCIERATIAMTAAATEHAPTIARAVDGDASTDLLGRDALIASAVKRACDALTHRRTLLVTLRGEPGSGKSSLLAAIDAGIRTAIPRARTLAIDDAHLADAAILDAAERTTVEDAMDVVIAATDPSLDARRPWWGARAEAHHVIAIPPLDEAASRALFAAHMRPVEALPESLVARVVRSADGNPQAIVDAARALHRSGAVRRTPGADGWYVAADEVQLIDDVPPAHVLARASTMGVAPSVLVIAQIAAALDDALSRDRLAAASRDLGDASAYDVDVAIARLAQAGVVTITDGVPRFASSSLRRAIAASTSGAVRSRIHAALHRLFASDPRERARAARHALEAGDANAARLLFERLAGDALAAHAHSDAEAHATAALTSITFANDDVPARRALLALRARARYRVQRYADAVDDIAAALALAPIDDREIASLALDEAMARDWMHDVDGAARAADRARPHVERARDERLTTQLAVADARTLWRRGNLAEAAIALDATSSHAHAHDDVETAIVSDLMLGSTLVHVGRLDDAERVYARAVATCERASDRFHLAVACSNRLALWSKLGRHGNARADLDRALAVARELGNVQLERVASHNLAELLYAHGDHDAALPLAERSRDLQLRFFAAHPIANDALLVARILDARGERADDLRALLVWIVDNVAPKHTEAADWLARIDALASRR